MNGRLDEEDRKRERERKERQVQRETQRENVPAKPRKRSVSCRSFPRADPSATSLTYTIFSPAHDSPSPPPFSVPNPAAQHRP